MENIIDSKVVEVSDYYNTQKRKFFDFLIGFLGYILLGYLAVKLLGALYLPILLLAAFLSNLFFKKNRKFINFGVTSAFILIFLVIFLTFFRFFNSLN